MIFKISFWSEPKCCLQMCRVKTSCECLVHFVLNARFYHCYKVEFGHSQQGHIFASSSLDLSFLITKSGPFEKLQFTFHGLQIQKALIKIQRANSMVKRYLFSFPFVAMPSNKTDFPQRHVRSLPHTLHHNNRPNEEASVQHLPQHRRSNTRNLRLSCGHCQLLLTSVGCGGRETWPGKEYCSEGRPEVSKITGVKCG